MKTDKLLEATIHELNNKMKDTKLTWYDKYIGKKFQIKVR